MEVAGSTIPNYRGGKDGGMPLVLFPDDLNTTVVMTPFSNFPVRFMITKTFLRSDI